MTIEEKARNYAGYDVKPTPDIVTEIRMARIRDDFKAGAEWMLEKAMALIEDSVVFDKFGRPVKSETFRKAMEE